MKDIQKVMHTVGTKVFEDPDAAALYKSILTKQQEIAKLKKEIQDLRDSCPHDELVGQVWSLKTEHGTIKVRVCKVCGHDLHIYPDGSVK